MLFNVMGDLRPVLEWILHHEARIEDRFSETDANIEIDDEDEVSFLEMCDDANIECKLLQPHNFPHNRAAGESLLVHYVETAIGEISDREEVESIVDAIADAVHDEIDMRIKSVECKVAAAMRGDEVCNQS